MMEGSELIKKVRRGYSAVDSRGVTALMDEGLSCVSGIFHAFSTRVGGVSPKPYDSLNLSLTRDDLRENVLRNYEIFFDAFQIDPKSAVLVNHEHGANIVGVDGGDIGRGLFREPLEACDGIITSAPEVTLVTLHADCGCVYLFDPVHKAIGLAHAGWKGTFKRIAQRMVERMSVEFGSDPKALVAALGPCICRDCFEVDEGIGNDFVSEFSCRAIVTGGKKGKAFVDIEGALILQLLDAGVDISNISSMGVCTFERSELLFSYRRDKGRTGAMIGVLKLNGIG